MTILSQIQFDRATGLHNTRPLFDPETECANDNHNVTFKETAKICSDSRYKISHESVRKHCKYLNTGGCMRFQLRWLQLYHPAKGQGQENLIILVKMSVMPMTHLLGAKQHGQR